MHVDHYVRALQRAVRSEAIPRRIRAALALLLSQHSPGGTLSPEASAVLRRLPALFASPEEHADELAELIGRASAAVSRERAPGREHPGPARARRARAPRATP